MCEFRRFSRLPFLAFKFGGGRGMLAGILRNTQNALDNVFSSAVVKPVVTVAVRLKTSEIYPVVGVFGGPRRHFVRLSNFLFTVSFGLFPIVHPGTSVYVENELTSQFCGMRCGGDRATRCCWFLAFGVLGVAPALGRCC